MRSEISQQSTMIRSGIQSRLLLFRRRCRCYSNHSHSHNDSSGVCGDHSHSHVEHSPSTKGGQLLYQKTPHDDDDGRLGMDLNNARKYCRDLVRTFDYSAYLISTFIPAYARDCYFGIRAFNIETARVAHQITNIQSGQLRLEFWKDTINRIFAGKNPPPPEPVAILLSHSISRIGLTKSFFQKIIQARIARLGDPPFPDIDAMAEYGEATYSQIMYLTLESMGQKDLTLDHLASHIGKATGIVSFLRGFSFYLHRNRIVPLPVDVCAQHGVQQEQVLRQGNKAHGLADATFQVATFANDHLITLRAAIKSGNIDLLKISSSSPADGLNHHHQFNQNIMAPFLQAIPTQMFLNRLENVDFDLFNPSLKGREWTLPWKLYRAYSTGHL